MKKNIKVNAVICPKCNQIIYSRYRYDYRSCKCGEIAIDGGFDYLKIVFKNNFPRIVKKIVRATEEELYVDWKDGKNKFGVILPLTTVRRKSKLSST